jgi:hypothetical protein
MTLCRRDENLQLVSVQKVAEFKSIRHIRSHRLTPINSTAALGYNRKYVGVSDDARNRSLVHFGHRNLVG